MFGYSPAPAAQWSRNKLLVRKGYVQFPIIEKIIEIFFEQ
jgi:hypothetical protein